MESAGHNTNSSDAKFDSYNIGRKEKVDYFSKNQPKPRKKIRDWKIFKGKNKFILLGILLAIILIAVLCWFFFIYLPNKPIEISPEEKAFQEDTLNIYNEASNLAGDNSDNIASAMAYINDRADRVENINDKFTIRLIMADIYWKLGMDEEALNYLSSLDSTGINDYTMSSYYDSMSFAYRKLNNEELSEEYRYKALELRGVRQDTLEALKNDPVEQASEEEVEGILNGTY